MSKPIKHAQSSVRKFGGITSDYIEIHNEMDSSKSVVGDNRHRVIFHTAFGSFIIEKMFGIDYDALEKLAEKHGLSEEAVQDILGWKEQCRKSGTEIKNSDGKRIVVRDIAEQHIIEDYQGFIPSLIDFTNTMSYELWMQNGILRPASSIKDNPTLNKKQNGQAKINID